MALIKKLENIGNAIREKTGKTDLLTLEQMVTEIAAIETGGGSAELPEEVFLITGSCTYRFYGGGWDWFLREYGDKITTKDITAINYMFYQVGLEEIPFDLNIKNDCKSMSNGFAYLQKIKTLPLIKGELSVPTGNYSGTLDVSNLFSNCSCLRNISYNYFYNFGGDAFWEASKNYFGNRNGIFQYCFSLRQLPDISMLTNTVTSAYSCLYYGMASSCVVLDEAIDIPVLMVAFTSNAFSSTFDKCERLKEIIFATQEDGTPYEVNWKNQTIDLTKDVGHFNFNTNAWSESSIKNGIQSSNITRYNSGITEDKAIYDETTYAALKDDPDAFCMNNSTNKGAYSRYNHTSAVNTINSLPTTTNTGCVIKFEGNAGASTNGGAINTLTEEEIAVAAAKGWTVTLV